MTIVISMIYKMEANRLVNVCVFVFSHFSCIRLFATLCTIAHQAPLSIGFSRQEVDCHALLQGIFPTQG